MCGGVLSAVLSTVAAAMPMIFTSLLRPPPIIPAKGCGIGVGTGFGAPGTLTMCVSTATIWSPCLAAGCPISVDVDGRALDVHLPRRLQVQVSSGLDLRVGGRLDLDLLRVQFYLPLRRREHDVFVRSDGDRVLRRVEDDAVLLALVYYLDHLRAVLVREADDVSAPRLDDADVIFPVIVFGGLRVLAVPQRADDVREAHVAVLEGDEDFILDFG